MSARWVMHPGRRDGDLVNVVTEEDDTEVGLVWNAENATLASSAPELLAALEELERLTVWVGGQSPVHDAIETAKRKARAAIARAKGGAA